MKIEVEISESTLKAEIREIATAAARELLRSRYDLTEHGKRVASMAKTRAAEMIASGEVQEIVAETTRAEMTKVVQEITTAEIRKAVRAEIKAMKERGQLEIGTAG